VASIDRLASKTPIALIAVAAVLLLGWFLFGAGSIAALTPEEAQQMAAADSSVVLLDVRIPQEFSSDTGHLEGAILIPVQELEERVNELAPYKDKTIIAYCRTGNRSGKATALLQTQGSRSLICPVASFSGMKNTVLWCGTDDWNADSAVWTAGARAGSLHPPAVGNKVRSTVYSR